MTKHKKRIIWTTILVLLLAYVSSYLILSRRGFRDADEYNMVGFYFFLPEPTDAWRIKNYGLVLLYYPLIFIDNNILGTGRAVASEPLWGFGV